MTENPTILVLGASGMLGRAVRQELARSVEWTVDGTQQEDPHAPGYLDVLTDDCSPILRQRHYRYIVNCIGILKPAVSQQDSVSLTRAIRVNALFPHRVAELAQQASILHMSTDGVFSGSLDRPYVETDPPDCPDAYGKTKALGECPAPNVLNIRCSLVGRDPLAGKGLIEWVLRQNDGAELNGFEDQLWNGVTTRQFAELCRRIIESDAFESLRRESGVHHFCPNPATTKYDLLCCIREAAGRNLTIRPSRSDAPGARILGTLYRHMRALYPGGRSWPSVMRDALNDLN